MSCSRKQSSTIGHFPLYRRVLFSILGLVNYQSFKGFYHGTQYFFLTEIINGTFGIGQGEEYTDNERARGIYLPTWEDIKMLSSIDVKPREVALKDQSLFN